MKINNNLIRPHENFGGACCFSDTAFLVLNIFTREMKLKNCHLSFYRTSPVQCSLRNPPSGNI